MMVYIMTPAESPDTNGNGGAKVASRSRIGPVELTERPLHAALWRVSEPQKLLESMDHGFEH
jgi:hypothetical protein